MTLRGLFFLIILVAAVAAAFFLWRQQNGVGVTPSLPTESQQSVEAYRKNPPAEHSVDRALRAGDEIKEMNEAAQKATEH